MIEGVFIDEDNSLSSRNIRVSIRDNPRVKKKRIVRWIFFIVVLIVLLTIGISIGLILRAKSRIKSRSESNGLGEFCSHRSMDSF